MIFYHIDHTNSLKPGMIYEPRTDLLRSSIWASSTADALEKTFPEGVGHYGRRILRPTKDPGMLEQDTFEFILETVRLRSFPELPSRLLSFFGILNVPSASDRWFSRLETDASHSRLFECETDDETGTVYSVDASLLDSPSQAAYFPQLARHLQQPDDSVPSAVSYPALRIHAARQYWLSCRQINPPPAHPASNATGPEQHNPILEELLIPSRVLVLRQIPFP